MAVTLADVAARAGVSSATVSRVLNGNYPVAGSTRERVQRAVAELDYVVNGQARALAAATSDLVGVLVNDVADPFFGIIASALQAEVGVSAAEPGGKLTVVCNTGGSPEAELTYLTLLERQRAAGVVLTGGAVDSPAHTDSVSARLARLAASGTRIVLCGRPPLTLPGGTGPLTTLAFDNFGGARRLTEHLLSLGHRRIGYVTGPAERSTTGDRLAGHRAALAAHGLAPRHRTAGTGTAEDTADDPLTVHGGYDRNAGYDATLELLRRNTDVTAVVAANDTVALGVCAALRDRGLRIPADVSVAGFDDLPFSADASPALTTVRIPLQEAGARAGRLVMGRLAPPPGGVTTIATELMVRGSTAPPAAGRV
ncbi:LacI family DNA-binding transcriptional regulator [Streptomyces sp. NRRL F-5123]|uniref:LacI family DNA-binding transcriptional regulator n=1 Tax=Streptomyces sp. NRRL F-5123 TaxID=1463856 RepID=UPI0004E24933|nr:LacI family DNA-binding transcriptional regulator [Streptomyces sp. NRRL F-5123]